MERLTHYDHEGRLYSSRGYEVALARLAAYEDTGLTPEEITAMRHTLAEYHKEADPLLRAKAEGRVMVLPVRVGQTVYFLLEDLPVFYPETNGWYIAASEISEVTTRSFSVDPIDGDEKIYFYPYSDIGRTVFLTREEAEAALRMDGDGNG